MEGNSRGAKHTKKDERDFEILESLDLAECNETLENKLEALVLKKSELNNSRIRNSKSKLRQEQQVSAQTNQDAAWQERHSVANPDEARAAFDDREPTESHDILKGRQEYDFNHS